MKKYVIYLLSLLMVLSPAAVFADVEAPADPGDVVETAAEPGDAASAGDELSTGVPAEEEALDVVDEYTPETIEAPASEIIDAPALSDGEMDWNKECNWDDDETRDHAYDLTGKMVKGLFKAKRKYLGQGTSLFYSDSNGNVVKEECIVTVTNGRIFKHTELEGEQWKPAGTGTATYAITNHKDGTMNEYYVYWQTGLKVVNGKTYYIQEGENVGGMVKTDAGVLSLDGSKYYIQTGGEIKTSAGWVTDVNGTRYYLPAENAAEGKLRIAEGLFTADGKTWYSANGGAVRTTGGLFIYAGNQYFAFDDGSVNTAEGFITVGGKKYICTNGGAIRAAAGVVDYGGKKYVALEDGSICTSTGFINAGGARYYVSDSSGALVVNKEFKSGSKKYHALANGVIAIGVHKWGKNYYYSDSYGAIRTKKGIVSWAGSRYYVKKGGKITKNKKFKYKGKTYIAGSTGAFFKGVFTWKKNLYYASAKGVLRTKAGAFTYNGNRYYSRKGGKLYKNKLFTVGSKKYLAQSDGTLKAGLFAWGGKYYLTDAKCAVITKAGIYTYGAHQYYVKKGGPLAVSEFVTYKDNHYYAGSDGAIVKKAFTYKGVTITPNSQTGIIPLEEYWKVFPNEAPQETKTDTAA